MRSLRTEPQPLHACCISSTIPDHIVSRSLCGVRLMLRLKVLIGLFAVALTSSALADPAKLSGSVTYHEAIALPPDAMLNLRLIDQTAPGAPARINVTAAIGSVGQVPLNFALGFDDQIIAP